jgi:membrane associated rhomboid family serine protease
MFPSQSSKVVRNLLILCVGVYALQSLAEMFGILPAGFLDYYGALVPARVWGQGQAWRVVTYIFLHANLLHIFFNMWCLWVFGQPVAQRLGERKFLALFMVSGITAGLFSGLFYLWGGAGFIPIIGASGALYGILLAFARFYPDVPIYLFLIVPVPARIAVWIMGGIALLSGMNGGGAGGVAHLTHLFGILGGWAFLALDQPLTGLWDKMRNYGTERRTRKAVEELVATHEFFDSRVDPILAKISKYGMGSLSKQERQILEHASGKKKGDNLVDLRPWRKGKE